MSDVIEIQRLRGDQSDKDASSRVLPEGQTAVVLDAAYHVLGDGSTALKDLRPMEDRRIDTVNDTDGPLVMSDVSPSIVAADTTDGGCEVDLPALATNQGRRLYIINVGAENSIVVNAQSGDGIGAGGEETITVTNDVTTTILIAHETYWEQVATGGGGSSTEYDVITGIYDTGWVANSDWTNAEFTITHNFGRPLAELIVKFFISTDGTDANANQIDFHTDVYDTDITYTTGITPIAIGSNSFKIQTGSRGVNVISDAGSFTMIDTETYYYRVLVYDPNKVAAASSVEKYSTGWVANSDWTNAELTVTHGLGAPAEELITEFWVSANSGGSDPIRIGDNFNNDGSSIVTRAGYGIVGIDSSSLKIQTATSGIVYIDDSGVIQLLDTESWYYKVVVYKPTFIARELEVLSYDTGWVNEADFADTELSVTHSLGAPLAELIVKFYMSTDGTDANSFEVHDTIRYQPSTTGTIFDAGIMLYHVSNSALKIRTGPRGVFRFDETGAAQVISTQGYYYRVVVYKPAILEQATPAAVKSLTTDYTITGRTDAKTFQVTTGATDRTVTLPAGADMIPGDEIEVAKSDSGAGVVTVSRAGTDTIEGDTSVALPSQYNRVRLRWTGATWIIESIKANYDSGWVALPSTGSNDTVTHNLGKDLEYLGIDAQVRNGTGSQSEFMFVYVSSATAYSGEAILANDAASILVQVGNNGPQGVASTGGAFTPNEYRVVVRRID